MVHPCVRIATARTLPLDYEPRNHLEILPSLDDLTPIHPGTARATPLDMDNMNNPKPPKTIKQLASDALLVQNACNLSGVVHGFGRAITDLRAALPNAGTDAINTHPVCVLWADKIASLTLTQTFGSDAVMHAYRLIREILEMSDGEIAAAVSSSEVRA